MFGMALALPLCAKTKAHDTHHQPENKGGWMEQLYGEGLYTQPLWVLILLPAQLLEPPGSASVRTPDTCPASTRITRRVR